MFSHCFPDLDFRLISDFLDAERHLVILRKEVKLALYFVAYHAVFKRVVFSHCFPDKRKRSYEIFVTP